jgi:hypothetical protein
MSKRTIIIHEAKTLLSRLVDDVAGGREYIIAKALLSGFRTCALLRACKHYLKDRFCSIS